ncbi:MAG: hypothetical protein WC458_01515 [Patescibacteria group bacterium]
MVNFTRPFTSIFTIVAFLLLTVVATVIYGGSEEQKAEMEKNFFYQKTRSVFDTALEVAQALVLINVDSSAGKAGQETIDSEPAGESLPGESAAVKNGFWSELGEKIKEEWKKSEESYSATDTGNFGSQNLFDWQRTETGTDLIFRLKSGEEKKLSLPFGSQGSN